MIDHDADGASDNNAEDGASTLSLGRQCYFGDAVRAT